MSTCDIDPREALLVVEIWVFMGVREGAIVCNPSVRTTFLRIYPCLVPDLSSIDEYKPTKAARCTRNGNGVNRRVEDETIDKCVKSA